MTWRGATGRVLLTALLLVVWIACTTGRRPLAANVPDAPADPGLTPEQITQFEPEFHRFDSLLALEEEGRDGIVFAGSSSIRKWVSLDSDMAPLPVVNRGFGGAIIKQVTHQTTRLIVPLRPKLVVFYCGENDIANDKYPAEMPLTDFKAFVAGLRQKLPGTGVIFVSLKPSPLRWKYWPKFQETNRLIQAYVAKEKRMWYVDVSQAMLDRHGRPKADLFVSDSLHMSEAGYAVWTDILKPQVELRYQELAK